MEMIANKCEAKQQPVANEIIAFVAYLSERSQKVAEHLDNKLSPVMRQPTPEPETNCKAVNEREYPPLFGEIKERLVNIERAFNRIEYALERTEL